MLKFVAKDIELTDAIHDYVEGKLERVNKFFENETNVVVTLRQEGLMKISDFSVKGDSKFYRSVTEHQDLYAAFDKAIDTLERLIRKDNEKKLSTRKEIIDIEEEKEEIVDEIIKYQTYEPKPMDPEDAKLLLKERRNNNFLTFIDRQSGKVNVIFRLKDGKNFGLVIPE